MWVCAAEIWKIYNTYLERALPSVSQEAQSLQEIIQHRDRSCSEDGRGRNGNEEKMDTVGFEPTTSRNRVMRSVRATPVPSAHCELLCNE